MQQVQQKEKEGRPTQAISSNITCMSSNLVSNMKVAGRLRYFAQKWYEFTNDKFILDIFKHCHIKFVSDLLPKQLKPQKEIKMNLTEQLLVDSEIEKLLEKGVIEQCSHENGEFISNIFLREKKDGSHRMILNLMILKMWYITNLKWTLWKQLYNL